MEEGEDQRHGPRVQLNHRAKMEGEGLPSCNSEIEAHQRGTWSLGRRAHTLLHTDQRLRVIGQGICQILQPAWRKIAYLRRGEQQVRMEPPTQFIHGQEYRLPPYYCAHPHLLQGHYEKARRTEIRVQTNKLDQSFRVLVHIRAGRVDKDIKITYIEHIHLISSLWESIHDRLRIMPASYWDERRIASSRVVG